MSEQTVDEKPPSVPGEPDEIVIEDVTVADLCRCMVWSRSNYDFMYTSWKQDRPPEVENIKLEIRQGPEQSGGLEGWVYTGRVARDSQIVLNGGKTLFERRVHTEPGSPKVTALVIELIEWLAEHVNTKRHSKANVLRERAKKGRDFIVTQAAIIAATKAAAESEDAREMES